MEEKILKHGVAILTENEKIRLETVSIGKRVPVEGNQKGKESGRWTTLEKTGSGKRKEEKKEEKTAREAAPEEPNEEDPSHVSVCGNCGSSPTVPSPSSSSSSSLSPTASDPIAPPPPCPHSSPSPRPHCHLTSLPYNLLSKSKILHFHSIWVHFSRHRLSCLIPYTTTLHSPHPLTIAYHS